ncbi:MAG: type II 3-dehydroquinate dehydratase [Jatrophihabitantaceae bacterium]
MNHRVLVLNGPNLGRLGTREPVIYGSTTYAELRALCERGGSELGLQVEVRQTEHEGELLGWLHEAADDRTPVVLNAAALTHTSVGLGDACAMRTAPLVEVHLSNVHKREEFRHHSFVSAHASGVIVGLGVEGYVLALSWIASQLDKSDQDDKGDAAEPG